MNLEKTISIPYLRFAAPIVSGLVLLGCSSLLMAKDSAEKPEMNHSEMMGANHAHAHGTLDVSHWPMTPAISMKIEKDAMSGWNIYIEARHFKFSPEHVNQDNVEGEGHAHLYVDEQKVARLYGSWFHLPALSMGRHSIKVQLNANDHSTLAIGANPIEIITIVTEKSMN